MDSFQIKLHAMGFHGIRNPAIVFHQAEPIDVSCDSACIDNQRPRLRIHVEGNTLQHDAVDESRFDSPTFQQRPVAYSKPFVTRRAG